MTRARRLAVAWLVLWLGSAAAAPQPPEATRAELARWLSGLATAGPQRWQYSFTAAETGPLETLSRALVERGYAIRVLTAPPTGGGAELTVTRRELHTPLTLERRNRELAAVASAHGARYEGVDLAGP